MHPILPLRRLLVAVAVMAAVAAIAAPGPASAAAAPVRGGLVTDLGGLNDRSFNAAALAGLDRAEVRLGATSTVLETRSWKDYEPNLRSVAATSEVVVGIGFLMSDALAATARQHPETRFAIVDFSYRPRTPPNVTGITFNSRQAGYMAGALAGAAERARGLRGMNRPLVVGMIGGQRIPPVTSYLGGFRDGVRRTCRTCRVLTSYSNDFVAQHRCANLARRQLRQGADVIFVVAGGCGHGASRVIRAAGRWMVGVDSDQSYLGPHVLTSAIKRVDVAVFDVMRRAGAGTLPGGRDLVYGVSRNGVGIGRVAPAARRFERVAMQARRDLLAGRVR